MFEVHISKHSPFFSIALTHSRSRSVARHAHSQAFTFSSQDRGRLSDKHISKNSLFHVGKHSEDHGRLLDEDMSKHSHEKRALPLKITVGCPTCTSPSIHLSAGERHSQDHGRLPAVHASKHVCRNHIVWTPFEAIALPFHPKKDFFYQGILGRTHRTETADA